jgi:hypothetical protein
LKLYPTDESSSLIAPSVLSVGLILTTCLQVVQWFMKSIHLSLTVDQAKALLQITRNQLFNVKYLDPRIPGHIVHPGELEGAEAAVRTLETALREDQFRTPSAWETPAHYRPLQRVK